MLKFRDYTPADGALVASWVTDAYTLRIWSAATYESWPVTGAQIDDYYGDRREKDTSFRPLMAEEDGVPVGHMIVQYADPAQTAVYFGFVIVDPACRGRGVGSRMLQQALELAFGEMAAEKAELNVFTCNEKAHQCYERLGFVDVREAPITIGDTTWHRWYMEKTK